MAPWWRNFGGKILPFTFLLIYLIERLREYQQQLSVRKTIFSLWILVKSMGANDGLEGKTTHLAGFYIHTISGQNIPKPPIVISLDFLIVGILYLFSLEFWRNFHNWNKKVTTTKLTRCVHLKKSNKCIFSEFLYFTHRGKLAIIILLPLLAYRNYFDDCWLRYPILNSYHVYHTFNWNTPNYNYQKNYI